LAQGKHLLLYNSNIISGVGKSSLLLRYALDSFEDETRTTIGVDFKHKSLYIDDELVSCQIWVFAFPSHSQSTA
jgi:hypothetical protein